MSEILELVRCAGREYGMRKNVYPKWIKSGRMSDDEAHTELAGMGKIYDLLKLIRDSRHLQAAINVEREIRKDQEGEL